MCFPNRFKNDLTTNFLNHVYKGQRKLNEYIQNAMTMTILAREWAAFLEIWALETSCICHITNSPRPRYVSQSTGIQHSNKASIKHFLILSTPFPAELHWGWKFIFVGWLVLAVWAVTLLSNSLQRLSERCFMRFLFCFCLIITVEMSCILFMVMIELLYRN